MTYKEQPSFSKPGFNSLFCDVRSLVLTSEPPRDKEIATTFAELAQEKKISCCGFKKQKEPHSRKEHPGPTLSFHGCENDSYYMLEKDKIHFLQITLDAETL